jgi:hypothetical protein
MLLATKNDSTFPSHSVFRRLGLKPERVSRVISFCEGCVEYDDVAALWKSVAVSKPLLGADVRGAPTDG